jgi:hypothetical protein
MAQCIIAQLAGKNAADYDNLVKEVAPEGLPRGIVWQIAGTSPEGLTVMTFWDSDEAGQFVRDNVKPTLEKHGIEAKISMLEVHKQYQRN